MADQIDWEVDVPWDEARAANQANWDDRVAIHVNNYGMEKYVNDRDLLSPQIRKDAPVFLPALGQGSLADLDVLHLQCHIGNDTLSLARLGGRVVGLDFSWQALSAARFCSEAAGAEIEWLQSDVLLAANACGHRRFDLIYTSIGTICWFPDLVMWAQQIAHLLRPGGVFFIRDGHPMMYSLDDEAPGFIPKYRYFADGRANRYDEEGTYAGAGTVEHQRNYDYPHPISEIIGSLLGAGLVLELFDEGRELPWKYHPEMVETTTTCGSGQAGCGM